MIIEINDENEIVETTSYAPRTRSKKHTGYVDLTQPIPELTAGQNFYVRELASNTFHYIRLTSTLQKHVDNGNITNETHYVSTSRISCPL